MAAKKAKQNFDINSLFDDFINESYSAIETSAELDVIEFAEEILFNGKMQLFPTQIALLKAFYGLPLTENEKSILNGWKNEDRTTWTEDRKYTNLVWESGRSSGKCFRSNTLVPTSKGMLYGYELVNTQDSSQYQQLPKDLYVPHEAGQVAQAVQGYNNGFKDTIKFTTRTGYSLEATPEHRIKVINKDGVIAWKYLADLEVGDYAAINKSSTVWPKEYIKIEEVLTDKELSLETTWTRPYTLPEHIDKNLGYTLGLLVGDGTWRSGASLEITSHHLDYEHYLPTLKACFGNESVGTAQYKNVVRIRVGNTSLFKVIQGLGYKHDTDDSKCIPWTIRQSPKSVVAAFLAGLFDTDGGVTKKGTCIEFSTKYKKLAKEVQTILLNFGIISKVKSKLNKTYNKSYWFVTILGLKSRRIFAEEIGFKLPRKQEALMSGFIADREHGSVDNIPYQKKWLLKVRESFPRATSSFVVSDREVKNSRFKGRTSNEDRCYKVEFKDIVGNCIKTNSTEQLTYPRIKRIFEYIETTPEVKIDPAVIDHFQNLLDCDYFFDPIVEITHQQAHTVDISVPGPESYIAGGFTNHNSTIISIVTLYELYKWITDKDPCGRYGLLPNSPVAIFVIGTSEKQITETLFKQIAGNARGSEFFSNLAERKEIEILTSEIRCTKKNIGLYAKHTNSPALRGYTIKCLVLDEAAFFENDEMGVSKANDVYSAVGKGVGRFGKEGYKIAISSAKEENDFIQQLYNVSRKHPQTLGFRLRTWDINLHKEQREEVLKANEDYVRDPLAAGLEYEGIRYSKKGAYFIQENVQKATRGYSVIDAESEDLDFCNEHGDTRYYVSVKISRLEPAPSGLPSFLHCDYGIKKDSAAVAFCHPALLEDGKWGIVVDGYLLWKPYVGVNSKNEAIHRIVSFMDVETHLLRVCKTRRVINASFDTFQSESTIQRLHGHGINTTQMSTSNANQLLYFGITKKLIDQGLLTLPMDSTWSPKAMQDLLGIIQLPNGKITHDATEKDIPDAIANAVFNCYQYLIQSGRLNSLSSTLKTIQSPTQASTSLLQGVPKKAMLDNQKSKIALLRSKNIR